MHWLLLSLLNEDRKKKSSFFLQRAKTESTPEKGTSLQATNPDSFLGTTYSPLNAHQMIPEHRAMSVPLKQLGCDPPKYIKISSSCISDMSYTTLNLKLGND